MTWCQLASVSLSLTAVKAHGTDRVNRTVIYIIKGSLGIFRQSHRQERACSLCVRYNIVAIIQPRVPYEQVHAPYMRKKRTRKYSSTRSTSVNFSKRYTRHTSIELIEQKVRAQGYQPLKKVYNLSNRLTKSTSTSYQLLKTVYFYKVSN